MLLFALSSARFGALAAQESGRRLQEGDRVRVSAPSFAVGRQTGILVSRSPDTLVIAATAGQVRRVPVAAIRRLERAVGWRSRTGQGALIGLASGLLVTGVIGYVACNASVSPATCFESKEGAQYWYLLLTAAGGAAGTGIGALIGSRIRTERWETVVLERKRAGQGAFSRRRVALALRVSF